jgi:hypothetical protein
MMSMIFAVFLLKFLLNPHHLGDLKFCCIPPFHAQSYSISTLLTRVSTLAPLRIRECPALVHQVEAPEASSLHRKLAVPNPVSPLGSAVVLLLLRLQSLQARSDALVEQTRTWLVPSRP